MYPSDSDNDDDDEYITSNVSQRKGLNNLTTTTSNDKQLNLDF